MANAHEHPIGKGSAVDSHANNSQGIITDFLHSAAYSAVQEPISGVTQIVDQVGGSKLLPKVQVIEAPSHSEFGSAQWHAQQLGAGVGMLLPFLLVHKGVKASFAGSALRSEGLLSQRAAVGLTLKEAAVTGFAYDAVLRPSEVGGNFWASRALNGVVGAGTFATLAGGSLALNRLAKVGAIENTAVASTLRNRISSGVLSGVPAGLVSAEGMSLVHNGKFASSSELGQSIYGMSIVGGALGAGHMLKDAHSRRAARGPQVERSISSVNETYTESEVSPIIKARTPAKDGKGAEVQAEINPDHRAESFEVRAESTRLRPADFLRDSKFSDFAEAASKDSALNKLEVVRLIADDGHEAIVFELKDGKVLKLLEPMDGAWNPEWGFRPFDAPLHAINGEYVHTIVSKKTGGTLHWYVQDMLTPLMVNDELPMIDELQVGDQLHSANKQETALDRFFALVKNSNKSKSDIRAEQLGFDNEGEVRLFDYSAIGDIEKLNLETEEARLERQKDQQLEDRDSDNDSEGEEQPEDFGFQIREAKDSDKSERAERIEQLVPNELEQLIIDLIESEGKDGDYSDKLLLEYTQELLGLDHDAAAKRLAELKELAMLSL